MLKIIRNLIVIILFTVGIGACIAYILYINDESLFISALGSFIGTCVAIALVFESQYLLDYRKHEKFLKKEIEENMKRFHDFSTYLIRAFSAWADGEIFWINKAVTTKLIVNEVYHFTSDIAYTAFINKGFELYLSKNTLQSLCPLYFYWNSFSKITQQLEAEINAYISKGNKPKKEFLDEYHKKFEAVQKAHRDMILPLYRNLRKNQKVQLI